MVVAEAASNLACVGARPLALVNCLNFGNPEHPAVMWQLSEAIDGMSEACRALDIPVVGGNVSLYNETAGDDIAPTPVVGMLGVVDQLAHRPAGPTPRARSAARVHRSRDARPRERTPRRSPSFAALSPTMPCWELTTLLTADSPRASPRWLSSQRVASTSTGPVTSRPRSTRHHRGSSSASGSGDEAEVERRCADAGVPLTWIGVAGGDRVRIGAIADLSLSDVIERWRRHLPDAFGTAVTH